MAKKKIKIGIMNHSPDIIEALKESLQMDGFEVITAEVPVMSKRQVMMKEFIKKHKPTVIVFDIPPPYLENYSFLMTFIDKGHNKKIQFVITTTNKGVLESQVGNTHVIEMIGKPFDLQEITDAVKQKLKK